MAVDYKKLKVGDKVRYLCGNIAGQYRGLTGGNVYEIVGKDLDGDMYIIDDDGDFRFLFGYIAHCFELVDDEESVEESPSSYNCACKHDSHIASLAKEVAELKRELSDLKEYVEKEAVLFDERLIEVETKKPSADKTQHITVYGSEYIDKLFGGDSE